MTTKATIRKRCWLALFFMVNVSFATCWAHKPSDSYLALSVHHESVHGQWDIALRDLENVLGLDTSGDGAITWGELREHQSVVAIYALSRLTINGDRGACPIQIRDLMVDHHSDGAYAVLRFRADCRQTPKTLRLRYRLFFDVDPQHRGLLRWSIAKGASHTAIFSQDEREKSLVLDASVSTWTTLRDYVRHGAWHIWIGYDHILFLLSLLLPAVFIRRGRQWCVQENFRPVVIEVLKVVTAFTIAHSITLSVAALGFVQIPSRWVESAIAASVVLAALNNLHPLVHSGRAGIAFGFGLVHGLGFASVLSDLGLPRQALISALLGFNLGVELGQVAIVAVFLPFAHALRSTVVYRLLVFNTGSVVIAGLATVWLCERSLNLQFDRFW